jgi:diguanylate cyclase
MLLNRLSMRVSLIVTVVAMGMLGLGLAVVSGRIYRDHAIDNERAALVEQVRLEVDDMRRRFDREADLVQRMYRALPARSADSAALGTTWDQLYSPATGFEPIAIVHYDSEQTVLAAYQPRAYASSDWQSACAHLRSVLPTRLVPVSGYCFADGGVYYSRSLALADVPGSHLQVVFDVVAGLVDIESRASIPLRLTLADGAPVYESPVWSIGNASAHVLVAVYPFIVDVPDSAPLLIHVAKDESAFYAKLERTRYAVIFAAGAVTLLFVLIALALLERTVIAPLAALSEQLRRVRQDESQLGQRVDVDGNAEIIELATGFNEMTTKLEGLYENLERMAYTDPLTRLPNRSLFHERLTQALEQAQHDNKSFALFIMDLDRFKEINDTLGHPIGDLLLQQVAARLGGKLRESDILARMGGDEFAVLLPAVTVKQGDAAARMLLQALRQPFEVEGNDLHVRASIGAVLYPDHGVDVNTLVQRADVAMYAAKSASCGHAFYDPEMDRHQPARLALMGELRQAIEQEQFVLYFQPKIGLASNRVIGFEALVRWRHPGGRLILPETFIPLLEQTGLIRSLTLWATGEALRIGAELRAQGVELPVAVNISARDLQDGRLVQELSEQLAMHHATADWLELELTESAVMADVGGALEILSRLEAMGFRLVLDDFGTGHSSLAYLKRLPLRVVKVDKSFVMGMARDENDAAIVSTSIALAHNLGLQVVAEGVDSEAALEQLRRRGCDAVQGLYLSRPLGRDELFDWLTKSHWGLPLELAS